MLILVERDYDNEEIFKGEAEDFLFEHDNDSELEMLLEDFENSNLKRINTYDDDGNMLTISKMSQIIY